MEYHENETKHIVRKKKKKQRGRTKERGHRQLKYTSSFSVSAMLLIQYLQDRETGFNGMSYVLAKNQCNCTILN